jgi:hypothetical protein
MLCHELLVYHRLAGQAPLLSLRPEMPQYSPPARDALGSVAAVPTTGVAPDTSGGMRCRNEIDDTSGGMRCMNGIDVAPDMSGRTRCMNGIDVARDMSGRTRCMNGIDVAPDMSGRTRCMNGIDVAPDMSGRTRCMNGIDVAPDMSGRTRSDGRTGFSREGASGCAADFAVWRLTSSRLNQVPHVGVSAGPASRRMNQ